MLTMRLAPPDPQARPDAERVKSLVTASALSEDRLQHVHVRATTDGCVDVVLFLSAADLAAAHVNAAALSSRLLSEYLPGWRLRKLSLEPPI